MTQREALEALCTRACGQAQATQAPVLASFATVGTVSGGIDPVAELEARDARYEQADFRFVWARPKDGLTLAARGAAVRFRASGPRRFHDMLEQVETALKAAVCAQDGEADAGGAPYALGGFAFFDELDDSQWPGFGTAQMAVPAWMALQTNGTTRTVVSTFVQPGDHPARMAEFLAGQLEGTNGHPAAASSDKRETRFPARAGAFQRADEVEGHRHWLRMVRNVLAGIKAGKLSKVVLARAVDLFRSAPVSPYTILKALRAAYPDCFSFLVDPGGGQHFMGATPERLANLRDGLMRFGALAGSAPRGERSEADDALGQHLLDDPKERHEHAIVVDAILEAIRPFGGEPELPDAPRLVKLSNVQHLYTPISLRPQEPASLLSLLARLHPTPAVGGFPQETALDLIRDQEDFDRGWYAGPVGWVNARGDGEFAVALRSGAFRDGRVRLFTGAGIVAGSDPETEYFETQLKLQPLLSALAHG